MVIGSVKRAGRAHGWWMWTLAALALRCSTALAFSAGPPELVCVSSSGEQGTGHSVDASLSADGRFVAFESGSPDLVPNDPNGTYSNVFLRDRLLGQTTLVSVDENGVPVTGNYGYYPSMTPDGRYIAFSGAGNLWRYDRLQGVSDRVYIRGRELALSANGRYLAFESHYDDFPGDTNNRDDIYVYDFDADETTRASVSSTGAQSWSYSRSPSISADGQVVAFHSDADNLVPGDTNGTTDVFVHDLTTSETSRVSVASDGTQGSDYSKYGAISGDGHSVAFLSAADNIASGLRGAFVHDLRTSVTRHVSPPPPRSAIIASSYRGVDISADGDRVVFVAGLRPTNYRRHAWVYELSTGRILRVLGAPELEEGAGGCQEPRLSADGSHVAFVYTGTDLLEHDRNGASKDVFVAQIWENQPPTAPGVDVVPHGARTSDDLTCVIAAESWDPDGDTFSYTYQWFKDGLEQSGQTAPTLSYDLTTEHEKWKCAVTPTDGIAVGSPGEDTVVIRENQPPSAPTVDVEPHEARTADDLECKVTVNATDPEGDSVTYGYQWYQDDVVQPELTTSTVDHSLTAKGETWRCVVTPTDGMDSGPTAEDSVTIKNSPPNPPVAEILPEHPMVGQDLTCVIVEESTDPDGDPVTYTYFWGNLDPPVREPTLPGEHVQLPGDRQSCRVTPNDGETDGAWTRAEVQTRPYIDLRVRLKGETEWIGDDEWQCWEFDGPETDIEDAGATMVYEFSLENDGPPAPYQVVRWETWTPFGWSVHYHDALEGGNDITDDISAYGGWNTGVMGTGESREFRVEVTCGRAGAVEVGVYAQMLVDGKPVNTDYPHWDEVSARFVASAQPDLSIRRCGETDWLGGDVHDPTGAGQEISATADRAATVVYEVLLENDGPADDEFRVKGTAAAQGRDVRYFDSFTGGTEITGEVTGSGWRPGVLGPDDTRQVRVEVSGPATAGHTDDFAVTITARSLGSPSNPEDAVIGSVHEHPCLMGRVMDGDALPVEGALVRVEPGGHLTYTRWDGRFAVPGLKSFTYTVTPGKAGHVFAPASRQAAYTKNSDLVTDDFVAVPGGGDGTMVCHALLVGIADYPGTGKDLDYADDDALDMRDALLTSENWSAPNITTFTNAQGRKADIKAEVERIAAAVDGDDFFLLYFSGFGTTLDDIAPLDESDGLDEAIVAHDAGITDDELGLWLSAMGTARYCVMVDASFGGGIIDSASAAATARAKTMPGAGPSFRGDGFADDLLGSPSTGDSALDLHDNNCGVVLTACAADETCAEDETLENGVFTYYLVEGIRFGEADADRNGYVAGEEEHAYAGPLASALKPNQNAQLYDGHDGALDFLELGAHLTNQPDVATREPGEKTWTGNNVYNTTGSGQESSQEAAAGAEASYEISVQNDGQLPDSFTVTAPATVGDWSVRYYSKLTGGVDITDAVAGDGWETPPMESGARRKLLAIVTAPRAPSPGEEARVRVAARSVGNRRRRDCGRIITSIAPFPQPDVYLRRTGDSKWSGKGVFHVQAGVQTVEADVPLDGQALYTIRIENAGKVADTFTVTGFGTSSKWRVRHYDTGADGANITSEVAHDGWSTGTLQPGEWEVIRLMVRPRETATIGDDRPVKVTATANSDGSKLDAAKVIVTAVAPSCRPDAMVALGSESAWKGDDVYEAAGRGQARTCDLTPGESRNFRIRLQNDGSSPDTLTVTAPTASDPWLVSYFDSVDGGSDITADVTGAGWSTGELAPGAAFTIRMRVKAKSAAQIDDSATIRVRATSEGNPTQQDAIRAVLKVVDAHASASCLVTGLSVVSTARGSAITFTLSSDAEVSASVLNLAGRPVKRLCATKPLTAGANTLLWDASTETGLRAPSGRYLLRLEALAPDGTHSRALVPLSLSR